MSNVNCHMCLTRAVCAARHATYSVDLRTSVHPWLVEEDVDCIVCNVRDVIIPVIGHAVNKG